MLGSMKQLFRHKLSYRFNRKNVLVGLFILEICYIISPIFCEWLNQTKEKKQNGNKTLYSLRGIGLFTTTASKY